MIQTGITSSDRICLYSVDSYLKEERHINLNNFNQSPQEKVTLYEQGRNYLYSEIIQRLPRIAGYILNADLATDSYAQGLDTSISKHVMDPIFVQLTMMYLQKLNESDSCTIVGAYFAKIVSRWVENQKTKTVEAPAKKGKNLDEKPATASEPEKNINSDEVRHITEAVDRLLGHITAMVSSKCINLNKYQCLSVAAALGMENRETLIELINSDLSITADVFDIYRDPREIIKSILLLDKTDIPAKPTTNQQAFLDSMNRWVFNKLNTITIQECYTFLISVYGTSLIDVSTKYINPKDCGTVYSNLLTVAKTLIN